MWSQTKGAAISQRTRITKLVFFCNKLQWWNVSKSSVTVNCLKYQNFEGLEMFEIMNLYGSTFKFQCFSNMRKSPPNFWSRFRIIHVWCIGWWLAQLLNPLACAKSWSPKRQDWPGRRVEEIFCKSGEVWKDVFDIHSFKDFSDPQIWWNSESCKLLRGFLKSSKVGSCSSHSLSFYVACST